ncbi:predicted protein [Nematostella vectensis]|uniref:Uncharacterized protein n=1 Tax=Nematostella vectensis TaxID=45351 RepID=A7SLG3_NEMVE|nr:predicted protein [Nematostella vectensis]|eukprot:XP_001627532.1 predicted protein [Nematostella vectensis]
MNGQPVQIDSKQQEASHYILELESRDVWLKRKVDHDSASNGKVDQAMASVHHKSPLKGPEKKKPKLSSNDKVDKSPVRSSALNSPKVPSHTKDKSPVRPVTLKKEAVSPTKSPKPAVTSPLNNKKPEKQESRLNSSLLFEKAMQKGKEERQHEKATRKGSVKCGKMHEISKRNA